MVLLKEVEGHKCQTAFSGAEIPPVSLGPFPGKGKGHSIQHNRTRRPTTTGSPQRGSPLAQQSIDTMAWPAPEASYMF